MIFSLRLFSRTSVHQEQLPDPLEEPTVEEEKEEEKKIIKSLPEGSCSRFTVWRKSLVISCKGFTVINSNGDLVYRVDSYMERPEELVLMDGSGHSVLTTLRHKKLGQAESWVIYDGEEDTESSLTSSNKPTWHVRKHTCSILRGRRQEESVLANVFRGNKSSSDDERRSFVVEGSFTRRSCKVLNESRRTVAEVKRKEAMVGGASFGLEVFQLIVQPDFDDGIAMALVLILDQMYS